VNQLQQGFEQAKQSYPSAWIAEYKTMLCEPLFDEDEWEEAEIAHTFQLVDACGASFYSPDRAGMLVLREFRPGCRDPFHHWGFMVPKSEVKQSA